MGFIGKFFMLIFSFFACMFLIFFLIRLNNGSEPFIGLSDVYFYLKNNEIDILKPFNDFIQSFNDIINDFTNTLTDFSDFTSIFEGGLEFTELFELLFQGIKYIGLAIYSVFKVLFFPVTLFYYGGYFIYNIITFVISFFSFIITF